MESPPATASNEDARASASTYVGPEWLCRVSKRRFTNEAHVPGALLTFQDADDCVQEVSRTYESMSYLQLRALSRTPEGRWSVVDRTWRDTPIRLTIQVNDFGRLRRRVSVEIVAAAEEESSWPGPPCVYWERYANGRLWKPSIRGGKAWTVALIIFVAGGLVAIPFLGYQCVRVIVRVVG